MSDIEVEDTLREIRERVLAESARAGVGSQTAPRVLEAATSIDTAATRTSGTSDSLARLQANLATTERAWSRLPPLVSNRRGWTAPVELWIKRQIKRAAHWFTWEQVNFNSAVHHALGDARSAIEDARSALNTHERALAQARSDVASLQASMNDSLVRLRSEAEADRAGVKELRARIVAAESRFASGLAELRQTFDAGIEQLRAEQNARADELRAERDARINAREELFQNEMRERVGNLLEEQRVCFKQLALEAGESAAASERARRQMEARLNTLEGRSASSDVRASSAPHGQSK